MIGFGRVLWKTKIASVNIHFSSIPFGGFCIAAHKTAQNYRVKQFLFILAGPLVNIFLALAAFPFARSEIPADFHWVNWPKLLEQPWPFGIVFFAANILLAVVSLCPSQVNTVTFGKIPNDGLQLWKTLFKNENDVQLNLSLYSILEGVELREEKKYAEAQIWFEKGVAQMPEGEHALSYSGVNLIDLKRFHDARKTFIRLLNFPKLAPTNRGLYLNNIAYVDILIGDVSLLEEACKYSEEAMNILGWVPSIKGTRGCVLVEMGDIEKGIVLLKECMETVPNPSSKALNACSIALAEMKRGREQESRKFYLSALELDSQCVLLERVRRECKFN